MKYQALRTEILAILRRCDTDESSASQIMDAVERIDREDLAARVEKWAAAEDKPKKPAKRRD